MADNRYVLGIDVGGTNIRLGLVDETFQLSDFILKSSQKIFATNDSASEMIKIIKDYIDDYGYEKNICSISIGFPSTLDKERKKILSTPNIEGLQNIDFVDILSREVKLPVYLESDVNLLILYDMFKGSIPETGITTGFYFGTGLGNAISINGDILIGKNGAAAELGHIPSRNDNGLCGCGNRGCVELFASGKHLQYLCDTYFDGTFISDIFEKHNDSEVIKKFISDLAIPVATEINILDPDYIVLGGGLTQMKDFPRQELVEAIKKYARKPYPAENMNISFSVAGQENGCIGAGIHAFKMIKRK